jgi:hypothetical protein
VPITRVFIELRVSLTPRTPHSGPIRCVPPAAAVPRHWGTLFNEDRFHALNLSDGQRVIRGDGSADDGRVIGTLGGVLQGDVLVCGYSAPFGGVDFARPRETPANVAKVIDEALPRLRACGARTVVIKLPPTCYGDNEPLIQFTLLNRGFEVERCELNQHVDLQRLSGREDYAAQLKSPARRALRRLFGPEFRFCEAQAESEWDRAYETLAINRAVRGRVLSISRDYLRRARLALGQHVRMFELFHADRAVAAALVYRVRERRELVVAWGDADHGLEHSPMNLLAYRMIERALADRIETLDLGTSTEHAVGPEGEQIPNAGLVQFKQSVLARSEPRLTLVRTLAR